MSVPSHPLAGRHALVCGASRGIGHAVALALARRGATVTPLARDGARLQEVAAELSGAGAPAVHPLVADLDDRAAFPALVEAHLRRHGPAHILVNNAGGPASGRLLDARDEDFLAAFGRHLLASHRLVQSVLPGMQEAGWGRIVNIVSTSVREPIPGLGVSGCVRSAMASWAKTLSRELPPGVTINSVLPGYTATERLDELRQEIQARTGRTRAEIEADWVRETPEGRLGQPEEIAAAVAFLCSPEASYVRGIVLPADGGRLRSI